MTIDSFKKTSTSTSPPLQYHHTLVLSFCFFLFVLFFFQSWGLLLFYKLKSIPSFQQVLSLPTKMPSWITTTPFLKSLSRTNQTFINYVWAIQAFIVLFSIYIGFSWKQPFGYIGTGIFFVLTLVSIALLLFFQIFITTFLPTLSSISSIESFSPSPLEPSTAYPSPVAQSVVTQPVPVPSIQTPIPPIQPTQPISFSVVLPAPTAIIATSTTVTTTTTSTSIVKHLKIVMWVHRVFLALFLLDILYLLYSLYSSKHSLWAGKSSSSSKTISSFSSHYSNRRGRGYGYYH